MQTLFLYVLSFLKRKYERKQFGICWFAKQAKQASPRGAKNPEAPLKVQGGSYLPRRLYQSKGGSAVRILKCFLIVRGFCACGDGIK